MPRLGGPSSQIGRSGVRRAPCTTERLLTGNREHRKARGNLKPTEGAPRLTDFLPCVLREGWTDALWRSTPEAFFLSQNLSSNTPSLFSIVLKLNKVFICSNFLVDGLVDVSSVRQGLPKLCLLPHSPKWCFRCFGCLFFHQRGALSKRSRKSGLNEAKPGFGNKRLAKIVGSALAGELEVAVVQTCDSEEDTSTFHCPPRSPTSIRTCIAYQSKQAFANSPTNSITSENEVLSGRQERRQGQPLLGSWAAGVRGHRRLGCFPFSSYHSFLSRRCSRNGALFVSMPPGGEVC